MQLRTLMLAQVQYGVNALPGSINPSPKPCIHMLPHTFQVFPTPKGPAGTIKLYILPYLPCIHLQQAQEYMSGPAQPHMWRLKKVALLSMYDQVCKGARRAATLLGCSCKHFKHMLHSIKHISTLWRKQQQRCPNA